MGRAWRCPECQKTDVKREEVAYNCDLASVIPMHKIDRITVFLCRNCRHAVVLRLVPAKFESPNATALN